MARCFGTLLIADVSAVLGPGVPTQARAPVSDKILHGLRVVPAVDRDGHISVQQMIRWTHTIMLHTLPSVIEAFGWMFDKMLYGDLLNRLTPDKEAALSNAAFVISAFRSASAKMLQDLARTYFFASMIRTRKVAPRLGSRPMP